MRITLLSVFLLAATCCAGVFAQTIPPPNDLRISGRVIGPLPLQYGQPSEFELTFTNLGPTTGDVARAFGGLPWSPAVNVDAAPGSPCHAGLDVTSDPPDPEFQRIEMAAFGPFPVGGSVVCRFRIVPVFPGSYPAGRSLSLFASWDYWPYVDPDLSNNEYSFGLDPPAATSVPGLTGWWVAGLAFLVAALALRHARSHVGAA
jgi:hypothetical protein